MKNLFTLVLCVFSIAFVSAQKDMDKVFEKVDQMPVFNPTACMEVSSDEQIKCSFQYFMQELIPRLSYPEGAKKANKTGKVIVEFVVNKSGEMKDLAILEDPGYGFGDAVLKAMADMGKWQPGIHEGKEVNVAMKLPVVFKL